MAPSAIVSSNANELLAVGFSTLLGRNIVPKSLVNDYNFMTDFAGISIKDANSLEAVEGSLDINALYATSLMRFSCGDTSTEVGNFVFVKMLTGITVTAQYSDGMTVEQFKYSIKDKVGVIPDNQRIIFNGKQLEDDRLLSDYGIKNESVLNLVLRLRGGGLGPAPFYTLEDDLLDPKFDFDFTYVNDDGKVFKRGGEVYTRPCGWKRYAMKVLDKFESNTWLGTAGNRLNSYPGEWPVSYHGTSKVNGISIAEQGYLLSKGRRFKYGHGIYSTPSVEIAEAYASKFEWRGSNYKVLLQNRVNPDSLQKIDHVQYWITPNEKDIRMYGLLIKKVN